MCNFTSALSCTCTKQKFRCLVQPFCEIAWLYSTLLARRKHRTPKLEQQTVWKCRNYHLALSVKSFLSNTVTWFIFAPAFLSLVLVGIKHKTDDPIGNQRSQNIEGAPEVNTVTRDRAMTTFFLLMTRLHNRDEWPVPNFTLSASWCFSKILDVSLFVTMSGCVQIVECVPNFSEGRSKEVSWLTLVRWLNELCTTTMLLYR